MINVKPTHQPHQATTHYYSLWYPPKLKTIPYQSPMMQGITRGPTLVGDLAQLRKSVVWSSPEDQAVRSALVERLEELLVMELHRDGSRSFLNFTVRGLYKHVLSAITSKISGKRERDEVNVMIQKKGTVVLGSLNAAAGGVNTGINTGINTSISEIDSTAATAAAGGVAPTLETSATADQSTAATDTSADQSAAATDAFATPTPSSFVQPPPTIPPPLPGHNRQKSASVFADHLKADQATYRERLGGYLHPRDMRRLVTPFSASNEPGLIVRRHVMLLNFDPMRAIILRDRLLVIVPDGADSILNQIEKRVRGGVLEMERSFLGTTTHGSDDLGGSEHGSMHGSLHGGSILKLRGQKLHHAGSTAADAADSATQATVDANNEYDEWDDLRGKEWIDLPFELQCTDAVLHTVAAFLEKDTVELNDAARGYIQRILKDNTGTRDDPLTIIRAVKEAVREMNGRVNGFVQALTRILDEDEDMALMNLSRLQTHPERFMYPVSAEILEEESDEPELILESYLQEGLSMINVLDSIQGQIDTTAELVDQRLDSVRNRILMANMVLTAVSVSISAASLVVSTTHEGSDESYQRSE